MPPRDPDTGTAEAARPPAWREAALRAWPVLRAVLAVAVPVTVLAVVWGTLRGIDYAGLHASVAAADRPLLLAAALAALAAVAAMGLYDVVVFPPTPTLRWRRRWLFGAAIFGWSNLITLGPIGPAIRVYLYRRAGMSPTQLSGGFVAHYTGIFAGMVAWVAAAWVARPAEPATSPWLVVPLALALSLAFTAAGGSLVRRLGRGHAWAATGSLSPSRMPRLAVVSFLDWGLTIFAFVLAARAVGLDLGVARAARITLCGHAVGFVSLVPGGLGSADAVWLKMLAAGGAGEERAAAAVVVFRAVFYLLPWAVALTIFYALLGRSGERALRWQRRVLAGGLGVLAALLLLSVATPAAAGRIGTLGRALPLPVLEVSHAAAGVLALLMLALVRGLIRGYRAAWGWACLGLVGSAVAHVGKGLDVEEALAASALLVLLLPARRAFHRRGRVPIGWHLTLAAVLLGVGTLGGVGFLAHRFPDGGGSAFTGFTAGAEGARFTRAFAAAVLAGLVLIAREALRPVDPRVEPDGEALAAAAGFCRDRAADGGSAAAAAAAREDPSLAVWFWRPAERAAADRFSGDAAAAADAAGLLRYQRRGDAIVLVGDPVLTPDAEPVRLLEDVLALARDEDVDPVLDRFSAAWLAPLHASGFHVLRRESEPGSASGGNPEGGGPPEAGYLAFRDPWGGPAALRTTAALHGARRRSRPLRPAEARRGAPAPPAAEAADRRPGA
ncbi:lysylphosphatidylglycerol synthase domain-containing protein [Phycisphaera mikurensis]|uniref:Phosphatidylglycerol lysyltransferase C-terminal domain-containing protein n=1 Tax=Phycisphaera mikurensis (strain NBRC 102666 / KCTC 22515 / FYK2301M01) TaxID=1142394 RepID=I0IEL2_PHYMF|nr:lysylphosphatidylglycerol synthase domain-containing protein [Phycisphaera mikurensis]MBB6441499.1 phosphatidylglycerol lysyltransferase [Phycisphaera mikurensis]BAM03700.1 hypothetical protein PSMK_15410 [Phycisphaera mikurensis NBRC 102666]